jgi:dihydrofolate reductase
MSAGVGLGLLVAMTPDGVIGRGGGLPWPRDAAARADLARFRAVTDGHACIVGRKTWETLPPLPGRLLLVLTRRRAVADRVLALGDIERTACPCASLPKALEYLDLLGRDFAWVIGGGEVYREALPLAYLIDVTVYPFTPAGGDVRFPLTLSQLRTDPAWAPEWPVTCSGGFTGDPPPFVHQVFRRNPARPDPCKPAP